MFVFGLCDYCSVKFCLVEINTMDEEKHVTMIVAYWYNFFSIALEPVLIAAYRSRTALRRK